MYHFDKSFFLLHFLHSFRFWLVHWCIGDHHHHHGGILSWGAEESAEVALASQCNLIISLSVSFCLLFIVIIIVQLKMWKWLFTAWKDLPFFKLKLWSTYLKSNLQSFCLNVDDFNMVQKKSIFLNLMILWHNTLRKKMFSFGYPPNVNKCTY